MAKRSAPAGRRVRAPRRAVRTAPDVPLSTRYIESSALVAALLERDTAARASIRTPGKRVTSALTLAEAARAILRARASGRLSEANERAATRALQVFARRCDIVSVTDDVLARVGRPFPVEPIRTLDAVHLATAEVLAEPPALVTIITRDARVRDNARALGYVVE
ncbi:MAG: PIN domain-containing protein [Vicinamibacterales bacterium]